MNELHFFIIIIVEANIMWKFRNSEAFFVSTIIILWNTLITYIFCFYPKAYEQSYEYMFGDDLLVAPVLEPGVDHWTAYLPGLKQEIFFSDFTLYLEIFFWFCVFVKNEYIFLGSNETWRWLWTTDIDVSFPGNQYIPVPAPIGMPAIFYKLTSPYAQLFRDIAREFILPGDFK